MTDPQLPPCRYRGELGLDGRVGCASYHVVSAGDRVPPATCIGCVFADVPNPRDQRGRELTPDDRRVSGQLVLAAYRELEARRQATIEG